MRKWTQEDEVARQAPVNDYDPDIARFHHNELLSWFDRRNGEYVIRRKSRFNAIATTDEALRYVREVRSAFAECLGELPDGACGPARVVRTVDMGGYRIDDVLIESLPGLFLNGSFYYPKDAGRPSPAILFFCGHSPEGKAYGIYASFCVEAVQSGFCVLTFDPVGHGERRMYDQRDSKHFTGSPDAVHYLLGQQAWLAGTSLTAYMMRDNVRALDYLLTRPEADAGAVAVAGNSGGGHMAAFMGAFDGRVKAVISSCYITGLATMIRHVGAQECEQSLFGFMDRGLDLADLVIAAAPLPCFIGASLTDFFPIDGTRDAWIDCRRIYRLLGAEDRLEISVAPKPHGFWRETREAALRFLCGRFGLEFAADKADGGGPLPGPGELDCTPGGDIRHADTAALQGMLSRRAGGCCPEIHVMRSRGDLDTYAAAVRQRLLGGLRAGAGPACEGAGAVSACGGDGLQTTEYTFLSEEGMTVYGTLYRRAGGGADAVLLHVGAFGGDDPLLAACLEEYHAVFSMEPRGTGRGAFEPGCFFYKPAHFENEEASMNCNAHMLGTSLAALRLTDALAAARLVWRLEGLGGCRLALGGRGEHALTALYAAVALGGADVRLKDLLFSLRSLVDNRMYLWGPSVFAYGLLELFDISGLIAALGRHSVRIDGLLDHMKNKISGDRLRDYAESLQNPFAAGGGRLTML